MNEASLNNDLAPSIPRAFVRVFFQCLLVAAVAAVSERYRNGHWWSPDYIASLAIPLLLMPTLVCLMFVPRRIQWSEREFLIQSRFGAPRSLPWTQLYAYGSGNNVFLLQFSGVATLQIFSGAFDPVQWKALQAFLATTHPDKKALFWLGPKAIRRNRNA